MDTQMKEKQCKSTIDQSSSHTAQKAKGHEFVFAIVAVGSNGEARDKTNAHRHTARAHKKWGL